MANEKGPPRGPKGAFEYLGVVARSVRNEGAVQSATKTDSRDVLPFACQRLIKDWPSIRH
jgi:hypothetical protein